MTNVVDWSWITFDGSGCNYMQQEKRTNKRDKKDKRSATAGKKAEDDGPADDYQIEK